MAWILCKSDWQKVAQMQTHCGQAIEEVGIEMENLSKKACSRSDILFFE
jgi:hypothetical protein